MPDELSPVYTEVPEALSITRYTVVAPEATGPVAETLYHPLPT